MEGLVPFGTALGLLALLELGDKTQLATISIASRRPSLPVFLGAATALILLTGIGTIAGTVISELLVGSVSLIRFLGGAVFIAFGVHGLIRRDPGSAAIVKGQHTAFVEAFAMNVIAELGDKSQLAVVVLAATTAAPVSVFLGASVALTALAAASVLIGTALTKVLRAETVRIVAALLFVAAGAFLVAEAIFGG